MSKPKTFAPNAQPPNRQNKRAAPAAAPAAAPGGEQGALFKPPKPEIGASITVEGEVTQLIYSNDETGFRVTRVRVESEARERIVVGVGPTVTEGVRVRATGKIVRDPKFGEQVRAETLMVLAPSTLAGVERFLGSGLIPGVGAVLARRIVETFGERTLDVLDHHAQRLTEVPNLGSKRAQQVQQAWEAHRVVGAIMIFLQSHGASPALASRIYKRFGARAIAIVSASPYRLALDVWGIGFKTADRIASSLGIAKNAPERAQAGVLHILHERAGHGHVFTERRLLADLTARMLEIDQADTERAIDVLETESRVRVDREVIAAMVGPSGFVSDDAAVYEPPLHEAELEVAARLLQLKQAPPMGRKLPGLVGEVVDEFQTKTKVSLADAQRAAIDLAAASKVVVVTGGPGVGKTTIVRALLMLFDRAGLDTKLAAPTGRAAKRMTEATRRAATTLHRLLEFDPKTREFIRDDDNPIDAGAIIVDESSMIDLELMRALLVAIPTQARLILVGDVDQLPSVGAGAVLRDVIGSGVIPTARLTTIFRQAEGSQIVANAHRIHAGHPPQSDAGQEGEFYVIERKSDETAADVIVDLVTDRIPKRFKLDPIRDVQVLTPMHRGPSGTILLNERLQEKLNPNGPSVRVGQRILRLGDKVMQLRNDYEREVYNGDVGVVCRIDDEVRRVFVRIDDREVAYEEGDLEELTLAYATSIHKSQGSEYPAVVIPFTMNHFVMLSRNLLYTAVTRGRRLVVLVADPRAVSVGLAETRKEVRSTALAVRLRKGAGESHVS